jgi:hypothetical protein
MSNKENLFSDELNIYNSAIKQEIMDIDMNPIYGRTERMRYWIFNVLLPDADKYSPHLRYEIEALAADALCELKLKY